ncbi:Bug family tripartite tricarboxylate transporter substrate binding protein [Candidimonas nitroreducens]|nr:tripartite tricarboxylate transporter substrate binding protein [Candidimonas nitroreducens]
MMKFPLLRKAGLYRLLVSLGWGFGAAASLFVAPAGAASSDYPSRAVTIVVPWPAGGTTDLAARKFAEPLAKRLGESVVIQNKPGATGIVGAASVAHSRPDGYTLLLASAETHAINPYTYGKLPYDAAKDFIPIAAFATNPYSIVARANFPAATVKDLVEVVKKSPGKYTYSSAGLGSASQIVMEMFKREAGLQILHVPFQGEAPAVTALMGGEVDMMVLPAGRAQVLSSGKKIKVYAVTTPQRFPGLPAVPTLKEEGYQNLQVANWFSLMAPANTPKAVISKISAAVNDILQDPHTEPMLATLGLGVFQPSMTPSEFARFVAQERQRWGDVVREAKIRIQKK